MIKLIAIDLDGTLINSNSEISQKSINILKRCLAAKIKVVIVSAKSIKAVMKVSNRIGLTGPNIAFGGAAIINPDNTVKCYKKITPLNCKKIIEFAKLKNKGVYIGTTDGYFYYDRYHPYLKHISTGGEVVKKVKNLNDENIINNALLITVTIRKEDEFNDFLRNKLDGSLRLIRGGEFFLDISTMEVSKLFALKIILNSFCIKSTELMAIGDSDSDLEMIKFAGIGVAMNNSQDYIKNIADYVTSGNDEDGVYHAINKLVFYNI